MIKAIFFATFDDDEGPKLHHYLPEPLPGLPHLFDFKALAPYLIPPPALCNTPLNLLAPTNRQSGSYKISPHRILSYPVHIASEQYPRNAFTFNFGLVLDASIEFSSYLSIVKKLATLFRGLEEQGRFLSKDIAANANKVYFNEDERREGVIEDSGLREEEVSKSNLDDVPEEKENDEDEDTEDDGVSIPARRIQTRSTDNYKQISSSSSSSSKSKIFALSEILVEDLNNYGETQIPLDDANTLNLKLFPTYPPPPPLYAWHVPLATVRLDTLLQENVPGGGGGGGSSSGDLTMTRILPYIDGVNSVHRIAQLADADLKLVRKAIRHLLYYGCCILLDIFAFGAIYAPTSTIASFVDDLEMQEECAAYVALPLPFPTAGGSRSSSRGREGEEDEAKSKINGEEATVDAAQKDKHPTTNDYKQKSHPTPPRRHDLNTTSPLTGAQLCEHYLSLRQGLTVKAWCLEHPDVLSLLDIRRFITFGVIKGFLYRVHKYAILTSSRYGAGKGKGKGVRGKGKGKGKGAAGGGGAATTTTATPANPIGGTTTTASTTAVETDDTADESSASALAQPPPPAASHGTISSDAAADTDNNARDDKQLDKFLDGTHCFDEICTELGISERELLGRLKARGADVVIICR